MSKVGFDQIGITAMPTNFDFLQPQWSTLHEDAVQAETHAHGSPRTCAFYARRALERMVKWLYANDGDLHAPYQENLAALLHETTFQNLLPPGLFHQIRLIHKIGNQAVHSDTTISQRDALQVLRILHAFLGWAARLYLTPAPTVANFQDALVPRPQVAAADKTAEQLQTLQAELKKKDDALAAREASLQVSEEELDRLRREIAELRMAHADTITPEPVNEAETRDLFIDVLLREAGWDPHGPNVEEYPVTGMPTPSGKGNIDYVLWGLDGLPLGIVEAKRTKLDPQQGKRQAELYADALERMTGQRPIIFYSNGYETWLWDDRHYPPREVQGFYKRDELQLMIQRRTSRKDLVTATANPDIIDRAFQLEALKRVQETFGRDKRREALLVMATGTGKTRLAVALCDILLHCNWARRILFLADRTALLDQAKKRNFQKYLPHVGAVDLTTEKEDDESRLVFSIYPTMMNCIDEEKREGEKRFGVGHFDLVIIDEAHRSVYQKFKAIFEYFDSLLLGLTATPRDEIDRDTYGLFGLEQGVPTYAYELEQAVADGFLVNFQALDVPTKFVRKGIKYDDLPDADKAEYESKLYDDDTGEIPDEVNAAAINKWLFNSDTVDKILAFVMQRGIKVEGGDKLGKTIIFARNHEHAKFIVERFDHHYPESAGHFCRVIDNYEKYAQTLIDDFSVKTKNPVIAVSVDMLDTGIDVPEAVNLVFFKPVFSRTKFWQMIGRGTRLCKDLFGPGQDKTNFLVFDVCGNLEFFNANPAGLPTPLVESITTRIWQRRLALVELLQDNAAKLPQLQSWKGELLDQMHEDVTRMNADNFLVRPHRRSVEKYRERAAWDQLGPSERLDIHEQLTRLPVPDNDDEFARRFDLLMLNLQLGLLVQSKQFAKLMREAREIASNLEEKRAIPAVFAQIDLIQEIQTDEYWQSITPPMLETARRSLRSLTKFLDPPSKKKIVITNFADVLEEVKEIDGLIRPDESLRDYRIKVARFVREHQNHITIQRLKRNQPITASDIRALEAILFADEGPGSREDFIATYGTEQPLGKLVREIVGLERAAAKEAFADFLASGNLTADQMTFINQIIDHLAQNGMMDPHRLFDPPFTDQHDQGVIGVMGDERTPIILSVIEKINTNALVA